MALVPCFEPIKADCAILPSCVLKKAIADARRAFLSALDQRTLADLVRPGPSLRSLLGIPEPAGAESQSDRSHAQMARRGRRDRRSDLLPGKTKVETRRR